MHLFYNVLVLDDIICSSEQKYYIQCIFVNVIFSTSWTMVFRNDNAISQIVLVLWVIFVPSNCILRFKSNLKITFCIAIGDRMLIWIRPDLFNKSISGNESNSNNLIYFLNRWWLAKVEYFRLTKVLLWWKLTKQSYPSILYPILLKSSILSYPIPSIFRNEI